MSPRCSRPLCSAAARAGFSFDPRNLVVWVHDVFDLGPQGQPLCDEHAAALTVPAGWTLEDRRIDTRSLEWRYDPDVPGQAPDSRLLRRAFRVADEATGTS